MAVAVSGSTRGGVPEIQRARLLGALVEVVRERGFGEVTVAHIVARSGVSRRTFYENFPDREACFLAAFDSAVEQAATGILPAYRERLAGESAAAGLSEAARLWREGMRGGLEALLRFLDDQPQLGGLCLVDALAAGPAVLERRGRVVRRLVDAVDGGRRVAGAGLSPTRLTAEGVVGGVLAVLHARLGNPRGGGPMVGLLSSLMGMIVMPYLGVEAAAWELQCPAPRARRRRSAVPPGNPLKGLDMRLTYRTMRVLAAIAATPGASNRGVARAAGVEDPGQISKLLARLEHVGVVENVRRPSARGEPNVWRLTPRGKQVERGIRQHTAPAGATPR